ncbi:ECF RNA polymerase sigma-E factor [Anatilimnocola aggregata]|uniref:ECF RNA polymerase sigma-E factor n=1 Tax=Anatilimnocola aggregata TaxID=2528021 RepID=A0A517YGH4_9BACT|nr:sigma-70 family RNA polymerase sigma factor [Anatilimnocola aggregata]QDU29327.1 ECF RNA polymerase sigma-E factor [Anatilimnocola aggregata]
MTTFQPAESAPLGESQLVQQLQAGDGGAFEQLVREHGPRLLAVARRYVDSDADCQDVLQDALLSAFRSIGLFNGQSQLGTWLHRITVNAALMKLRSQRRRPERSIEALLPKFIEDGHRLWPGGPWKDGKTHDPLLARETCELVRNCIDQLPESYRVILLLRDLEERSAEETAELLQLSPANVKTRLHRARLALRELLDPHFQGPPS